MNKKRLEEIKFDLDLQKLIMTVERKDTRIIDEAIELYDALVKLLDDQKIKLLDDQEKNNDLLLFKISEFRMPIR